MKKLFAHLALSSLAILLLFIQKECFGFMDYDNFIWGGKELYFKYILISSFIILTAVIIIDNYLKSIYQRWFIFLIQLLILIYTITQFQFIEKIKNLDEGIRNIEYPELISQEPFPISFQITAWCFILCIIIYFLIRIYYFNRYGKQSR
jgi:hypothetical protein